MNSQPNTESDHPLLTNPALLRAAAERLLRSDRVRLDRLWAYYRNPLRVLPTRAEDTSDRPYRQAQEWGLPSRVTGCVSGAGVFDTSDAEGIARKEVVIENDIGWRIDTMIDFLFGRAIVINSTAADPKTRQQIESLLKHVIASNGGLVFLQQIALLGAVYGSVDVLVKYAPRDHHPTPAVVCSNEPAADSDSTIQPHAESVSVEQASDSAPHLPSAATADESPHPGASSASTGALERLARTVRFEIVEPARALPLLNTRDCRCACAFASVYQVERTLAPQSRGHWLARWLAKQPVDPQRMTIIELITPTRWQRIEDDVIVSEGINSLGRLPLVHIQNTPDPLSYCGASDVEPLIPIQDELNTRLSDRAHRVAMTSLRMYLGKGIENFTDLPIAPGRMWSTDNVDANVIELGGDGHSPSEQAHIDDIREAMDKLSGISPIAAGAIKGRIGRLSSAAALRVTMMALLSRTERKRTVYAVAIAQLCELALAWLDQAGEFTTDPADRGVTIHWSNPIPVNEIERLEEARAKQAVGVPTAAVLRELGYPTSDA